MEQQKTCFQCFLFVVELMMMWKLSNIMDHLQTDL